MTEGVREWLAEAGVSSPYQLDAAAQLQLQRRFIEWKLDREASLEGFVSDRTVVDGLVITKCRLRAETFRREFHEEAAQARAHLRLAYDLFVVPPFTLRSVPDVCSTADPVARAKEHRKIRALVRWCGVEVLELKGTSLEAWVGQVIARCAIVPLQARPRISGPCRGAMGIAGGYDA